jgi:hypothetical protein
MNFSRFTLLMMIPKSPKILHTFWVAFYRGNKGFVALYLLRREVSKLIVRKQPSRFCWSDGWRPQEVPLGRENTHQHSRTQLTKPPRRLPMAKELRTSAVSALVFRRPRQTQCDARHSPPALANEDRRHWTLLHCKTLDGPWTFARKFRRSL